MKYLIFFFSLPIALIFKSCAAKTINEVETESFVVTSPIILDTLYLRDYVADIEAVRYVELRARVKGYIEKIYTDEGKFVQKGEVLFSISSQEYEEDLLKARANLKGVIAESKAAELDLHNVRTLVEKNVISKTEMEIAQAKLSALNARVEEARSHEASALLRLSMTNVRAPFSGIIDRIPHKVGSLVDEGELLTTLSDNSEVFAYFNVSEKEYLDYAAAVKGAEKFKTVSLVLANNSLHTSPGKIETIEGEFDKNTGNIAFRARFENPEKILKHGSSGKIRLRQDVKGAMVIPQKSAFEIQDRIYVYVVNENNEVVLKSFVPKLRIPHLYIVGSGLTVNDRFIYEGIQDAKGGMKIKTENVALRDLIHQL